MADNTLGIIFQTLLRFGDSEIKNANLIYAFGIMPNETYSDFKLLENLGLISTKLTLSNGTFIAAQFSERLLIQKSQAALVGPSSGYGILQLREKAKSMKILSNYLKNKYGTKKQVDEKDLNKLSKQYRDLYDTLIFNVEISKNQIKKLNEYLAKYLEDYKNKELENQETLFLPVIYATTIWNIIDSLETKNLYGKKRIFIKNNGVYFCHSLLFLVNRGLIKIHEFRNRQNVVKINQIDGAVIDNLYTKSTPSDNKEKEKPSEVKIDWPENFHWDELGINYIMGNFATISFPTESQRKKVFQFIIDKRGQEARVDDTRKFAKCSSDQTVRVIVGQLNKEKLKGTPISFDENGKEPGSYKAVLKNNL